MLCAGALESRCGRSGRFSLFNRVLCVYSQGNRHSLTVRGGMPRDAPLVSGSLPIHVAPGNGLLLLDRVTQGLGGSSRGLFS